MIVLGKNGEPFATITQPFRSAKFPLSGKVTADYQGFHRGDAVAALPSSTKDGIVRVILIRVHATDEELVRDPKPLVVDGWVAGKPSAALEHVYDDIIAASKELNACLKEEKRRS